MTLLLLAQLAHAAPVDLTAPARPQIDELDPEFGERSPLRHEVNVRTRYLSLPDSVLDIWFEGGTAGTATDRPKVSAYALGVEYVLSNGNDDGIFYLEWIKPTMDAGLWDDREEPKIDDGSWIQPEGFGLVALGMNYSASIPLTPWLELTTGAGLGVGFRTGELVQWQVGEPDNAVVHNNLDGDCGKLDQAHVRKDNCGNDGYVEIPAAIPIVDINVGPRFRIGDKAVLRIEGGFHDLLYFGGSFGATF